VLKLPHIQGTAGGGVKDAGAARPGCTCMSSTIGCDMSVTEADVAGEVGPGRASKRSGWLLVSYLCVGSPAQFRQLLTGIT